LHFAFNRRNNRGRPIDKAQGRMQLAKGTVIIADDHPLFREAMQLAVSGLTPKKKVQMVGDFPELERIVSELQDIDIILLDLNMPGSKGVSGLLQIRASHPAIPVAVVSATDDPATIRKALELGASGFIPKSLDMMRIREAITRILDGDVWAPDDVGGGSDSDEEFHALAERLKTLTPQQGKVLGMLGEGLLNKQIAYELGVSEATVKAHVSAVLLKLGVSSRTQAVIAINRLGAAAEH
jgi:DNA-binding NarL/FixJ family response regulator